MEEFDVVAAFGAKALGSRFAIYVPNKDQDGKPVIQQGWVDDAVRILSGIGGGATAMPPVQGAWLNTETNELILEEPIVVYSYLDPYVFVGKWTELHEFAKRLGRETNQGAVGLEYDGVFFLMSDFT